MQSMAVQKITVPALRARKAKGQKIAVLTAYDATFARLLEEGGADVLLVGDSLGMVIQGLQNTLPVTLDEICYHGRAVMRAVQRAHVVGDMPFMSYQVSPEQALVSAGQMLKEGGFEAVKLEGGEKYAAHVRAIVEAGIPVMGHVGLLPQSVHAMGGFRVQGTQEEAAERVLADARALEQAGAYAIVIEGVPAELGRRITEAVSVPTIGIGAGPHCDGQVLVCYDFLGMYSDVRPKFVKRFAELGQAIVEATRSYVGEVQAGQFPAAEHSFGSSKVPSPDRPTGSRPVVDGPPPGYGPASDPS
jgi:3-methyl-2-oxobutanoate hydroxymethyltransferase